MTQEMEATHGDAAASVGSRWPEVAVAGSLLAIAVMVIVDSLRVGIGWADDGPMSGYFPFYIGLMLMASSGFILLSVFLGWKKVNPVFADREQLSGVFAMLIPMIVYVVAVTLIGIYLASAALIGYFMRRHGKFGWLSTAAVSVGVPVVFFLVFERWFLVPLPKGPIENMLGF
ncbi:MAG TPA: tripartite tricarboxylate transporter TctB family protein [Rhodocyclaceae bacterium]|nr:tripartite tricarboxylate transporter TctB family protein [Rhodocyclaceae bacterium]HMV52848.1 tripartite tricarboxylate transporter TctB family protein [Rhodocyclaceae bacterium]HMZ82712.1 tripartite tricarboxylate transporter TctB family protein [Rhodocyclaceae bacterium]HNA02735.1 tripartite tricarboxylate transporter TctB family protein [Rhodocyclaceae bacterium]HNB77393.1 tripartite tricarboxylate transporter TctB family protein [Rhodocyclaceae bacterium]